MVLWKPFSFHQSTLMQRLGSVCLAPHPLVQRNRLESERSNVPIVFIAPFFLPFIGKIQTWIILQGRTHSLLDVERNNFNEDPPCALLVGLRRTCERPSMAHTRHARQKKRRQEKTRPDDPIFRRIFLFHTRIDVSSIVHQVTTATHLEFLLSSSAGDPRRSWIREGLYPRKTNRSCRARALCTAEDGLGP